MALFKFAKNAKCGYTFKIKLADKSSTHYDFSLLKMPNDCGLVSFRKDVLGYVTYRYKTYVPLLTFV